MEERNAKKISYTPVKIKVVDFRSKTQACPGCGRINTRHKTLKRPVIDIDLERPAILVILYTTYICKNPSCATRHYQIDNPLVDKGGRYTRRAKDKMVKTVKEDGATVRVARNRGQRDFHISPANASISRWSQVEASSCLMQEGVKERVIHEFSGILCVDETYDKDLAMIVAVDPVQKKTLAYAVTKSKVDETVLQEFLKTIKHAGLNVQACVTDKSPLYPKSLKSVFGPQIRHQLCLYHLSSNIVFDVYRAVRSAVYEKSRTRQGRKRALKQIHLLLKNPSNLLRRAGKTRRSQKRWAAKHSKLLSAVREILEHYPYLKIYHQFMQAYYAIWEAETQQDTWARRDALINDPRYKANRPLSIAMTRLKNDEIFRQYLYHFEDPRIPRTNNDVERMNRKFRQHQKRRYRGLRYEKTKQEGMLFRMGLSKNQAA